MGRAHDFRRPGSRHRCSQYLSGTALMRGVFTALLLIFGLVAIACARAPLAPIPTASSAREVPADAATVRVTRVIDGDTVEVRDDVARTTIRVRLAGIDAPERGQPFATRARERLGELLRTEPVRIQVFKHDRYDRAVGNLWAGGTDVGLALIAEGLAWHFSRYAHEQPRRERAAYEAAQAKAQANRVGLWRDPEPMAPWQWRARDRMRD